MRKESFFFILLFLLYGCAKQPFASLILDERLMLDQQSTSLSSLYISIEPKMLDSIHQTQSIKAFAEAVLVTADSDTLYEGDLEIKTRGNSTFLNARRKPYSITFSYRKRFEGLYEDKSFTLLPNNYDRFSHISNALAFDLAHSINLPAPKYTFIQLFLNGEYKGIYQMTNKIEVDRQMLPIRSLTKENKLLNPLKQNKYPAFSDVKNGIGAFRKGVILDNNPVDISGGYLLDHTCGTDQYKKSPSGFISDAYEMIRIRAPKHASKEEVNYIANFYNQTEAAVYSPDGYNPHTGKHYSQYLNLESFSKYYLIQELLQHVDAGANSFMMYKDADDEDSLLQAGPIWDFDLFSPTDESSIRRLYAAAKIGESAKPSSGGLLYHLWQHEDFRQSVKEIYIQEVYPALNSLIESNYFDSLQELVAIDDKEIRSYLRKRSDFLYWLWTTDTADIICVQVVNSSKYERAISFYAQKSEGIRLPHYPVVYNRDPIITWHLIGEETPLPPDTVFYSNQQVEMHYIEPSWFEVQFRRIKKRLHKMTESMMSR